MKKRWGVESTFRFWLILLAFSLAGSSIMFVKKPVYHLLHVPADATLWLKIPLAVMMYQVLLLCWGTAFGEFRFFWEKEKRLMRLLTFRRRPREAE